VADHNGDTALMSEFSTTGNLDATLDFGFYDGARDFVSKGHDAIELGRLFERDGWYTGHGGNAQNETTFISNHDDGRFGSFLKQDNPKADADQMGNLFLLGQELLLTVRGQPVIYYGDEQGMVGTGNDMGAREDMFPSRAPEFRDLALLGTTRRGGDDKFDRDHPFYRTIGRLAALRTANPALAHGAMLVRESGQAHVFAFSRIERSERVEFLVALNNSRTETVNAVLPTCQPPRAVFRSVFDSRGLNPEGSPSLAVGEEGHLTLSLAPLQCLILRAQAPLPPPSSPPSIKFAKPARGSTLTFTERSVYGQTITERQELRAEVTGGDGFAEVTFLMKRASRPNQYELLGVADAPPYRVFWRPPADLAPGDDLSFIATADDLRGQKAAAVIDQIRVAPGSMTYGIKGATVPVFNFEPVSEVNAKKGHDLSLAISASGTGPLEYSWLHDGNEIAGASQPTLTIKSVSSAAGGHYRALVRNREGTAVSRDIIVHVGS
jgi:alpha-amylase